MAQYQCPKCRIVMVFAGDQVYCPNCKRYYQREELLCGHGYESGKCPQKDCDFNQDK